MITAIRSEHLIIVSDLHLGNPFSNARKHVVPFIRKMASLGYDIPTYALDGTYLIRSWFRINGSFNNPMEN